MSNTEFTFTVETPEYLREYLRKLNGWTGWIDETKPLSEVAEDIEFQMIDE